MSLRRKMSLSLLSLAFTSTSVYAFEVKTEGLGKFEIGGALSGYILSGNQRIFEEDKKSRADLSSAMLFIIKKEEIFGFTLQGGAYAFPTLGVPLSKTSDYTELFSPLPIAYLDLYLTKNLTISAGRLGTVVGYEAPFTYQNNYIQRGLVWNMQPLFHHGVRVTWVRGPFNLKVGLNDGYYSAGVDSYSGYRTVTTKISPTFEFSSSFELSKAFNLSFNLLLPKKSALPNEVSNPANKRQYNLVFNYVGKGFSIGVDTLLVEAPKSTRAQVPSSATSYGFALHSLLERPPFKLGARLEFVKDKRDRSEVDLIGLGDGNRAYTFTLTPGYYKDPLFLRGEFSYVKAKKDFTYGKKDYQSRIGLEMGFKF